MKDHLFKSTVEGQVYGLAQHLGVPDAVVELIFEPTFEIEFRLIPDIREAGLKCIDAEIKSIKSSLEWQAYRDNLKLTEKDHLITLPGVMEGSDSTRIMGVIELDLHSSAPVGSEKKWGISANGTFDGDGAFEFTDCIVDFVNMTIVIS